MIDIYTDGGVIRKNPSAIGGTWAYCFVEDGKMVKSMSGFITPIMAGLPAITNNLTEMLAAIYALQAAPAQWAGTLYSDSQITLGRIFKLYRWAGIPAWMRELHEKAASRLCLDQANYVLLQGHPTKAELATGMGRKGLPVSEYNVWCDKECARQAEAFLEIPF